jgi:hypothetical protein
MAYHCLRAGTASHPEGTDRDVVQTGQVTPDNLPRQTVGSLEGGEAMSSRQLAEQPTNGLFRCESWHGL